MPTLLRLWVSDIARAPFTGLGLTWLGLGSLPSDIQGNDSCVVTKLSRVGDARGNG